MPGKLPIDRLRAAEDVPRIYQKDRQRFAERQAKLRNGSRPPGDDAARQSSPPEREMGDA